MRWVVKTSLDGIIFGDVFCDGTPFIPDNGASGLLPLDGRFVPAVVSETTIDQNQEPAVLRVICLNPDAYAKN